MITAVIAVHIFVSMVLITSVLLQVGKGASIGSAFGGAGSQTLFGSGGPATLLTKVTAACAVIFMVTSLYLTITSAQRRRSSIMRGLPAVTAPVTEPTEQGAPPGPDEAGAETPGVEPGVAPMTTSEPGEAKAPPPAAEKAPAAQKAPAIKEPAPAKADEKTAPKEGPGNGTAKEQ